jgi:predicted Zn-dependent peptidase
MYEDSPDEIIHELLGQNLWKNSKLGKPILGTADTVASMTRDGVLEVFRKQYVSGNMMICVAGNFEFSELISLLEKQLINMRPGNIKIEKELPKPSFDASVYSKEIEQVHLTVGGPGVSFTDPDRFPITILNAAFGGGMSSRLFQEIREKRGLAYTVYSYHTSFRNAGLFGIYAGTSIESLKDVLDLFKQEIDLLADEGLTDEELQDTKDQLKGNMLIALESTTNRMNRLATEFLYGIAPKSPTEAIAPYMAVKHSDVIQIAKKIIREDKMAITMIAPSMDAADMLEKSSFSGRKVNREKLGKSGK